MAARTKTIAGIKVQIWETSFRVDGMSRTVWVAPHMTDEMVEQLVTAVHGAVAKKAERDGRRRASKAISQRIDRLIFEDAP